MKLSYTDCLRVSSDPPRRRVDAGLLRIHLAQRLADWKESRFVPLREASTFRRLTRQLARITRQSVAQVERELEREAEELLS